MQEWFNASLTRPADMEQSPWPNGLVCRAAVVGDVEGKQRWALDGGYDLKCVHAEAQDSEDWDGFVQKADKGLRIHGLPP